MNKFVRHFIFSNLGIHMQKEAKKKFPDKDFGKLVSMSFIMTKEQTNLIIKMERVSDESILDEKERDKLARLIGIDVRKDINNCSSIYAIVNNFSRTISLKYNYIDGTSKTSVI